MKKALTITLLCLSFFSIIKSQPVIKGIAEWSFDSYQVGDTIRLDGYRYNSSNNTEVYILKSRSGENNIPVSWIKLLEDDIGFWTKIWFQNRALSISNNSWQLSNRNLLYADFNNYRSRMEEHDLFLRDDYLEEYLRNLIGILHPECLIRPQERSIEIMILKSPEPEIYSFNHGVIVITTGKIAELECEEDLAFLLTEYIAHIVLEDNLANLNRYEDRKAAAGIASVVFSLGSNIAMGIHNVRSDYKFTVNDMLSVWDLTFYLSDILIQPPIEIYTLQQIRRSQKISCKRFDLLSGENFSFHSPREYGMIMSSIIRDLAWEKYFQENYDASLKLIDRLIQTGITDEEDYLLKTKIYLAQSDNYESNLQALRFVETAEQMDQYHYVELQLQKGIILTRLERYEEAQEALLDYLSVAESSGEDPEQIDEAKKMLNRCNDSLSNL